ncbi:uncharacterized protein LOC111030502 [Myzus persicae]|uniref:uncharacterized protein LOC111030502 n=1 Tax=Myzus persicae TaxID=13164 RepID=UPI000B932EA8|nr:uncharacterized protein LOC111030502 [Myzus persicae]
MIITWLCVFFMTFNLCTVYSEETIKASKVKIIRSIKNSVAFHTKRFIAFMRRCPSYLRRFLIWLKKYAKHGIKCTAHGLTHMKCTTMDGLNKVISNKAFKRIPSFIRKRWTKTTLTSKLCFKD